MWIKYSEDNSMPLWLKENITSHCKTCGSEMEHFYLTKPNGSVSDRCTNRRCPNSQCPETLGVKISNMADIFKWEGIGPATGMKYAKENNLSNHIQAIPLITNEKPKVTLNTLLKICFIPGMSEKCNEIETKDYNTVEEFIENYHGFYAETIRENKDLILEAGKYLELDTRRLILKYEPILHCNIMVTGEINHVSSRELFPSVIAQMTEGLVSINIVGKRKTNVTCLIREDPTSSTGKVATAIDAGIPIFTSQEFYDYLSDRLDEELKKRGMI